MADIVINGTTYKDVPSIEVPSSNGGTSNYIDDTIVGKILSRYATGTLNLPDCTLLGEYCLYNTRYLSYLVVPKVTAIYEYALNACRALKGLDLPVCSQIGTRSLSYTNIAYLILRNENLVTLSNYNGLESTPIAQGTGYIYVPSSLLDSYKTATNWSVYADQFRALEDYTVDGTTTGELDESKI